MPATDLYSDEPLNYAAPAYDGNIVTPDNANDLEYVTRGLWIGGAGAISVDMAGIKGGAGASALVISGIPAGTLLPIAVKRVRVTGTTATLIVALR